MSDLLLLLPDVSSLLVKDAAYGRHVKQNCLAGATSRLPGKSELVDLRNKKKVDMFCLPCFIVVC